MAKTSTVDEDAVVTEKSPVEKSIDDVMARLGVNNVQEYLATEMAVYLANYEAATFPTDRANFKLLAVACAILLGSVV